MESKAFERSLYLHKALDVSATAHQAGTVRFGTDPATSALDVHRKAHDLDNLYVVDGSFMPSISVVNPTLTRGDEPLAEARRVGQLAGSAQVHPDYAPVAHRIRSDATDNWGARGGEVLSILTLRCTPGGRSSPYAR